MNFTTFSEKEISIEDLNNDCLIEIFNRLPITDLSKASQVCTKWRDMSYLCRITDGIQITVDDDSDGCVFVTTTINEIVKKLEYKSYEDLKNNITYRQRYITELSCRGITLDAAKVFFDLSKCCFNLNRLYLNLTNKGLNEKMLESVFLQCTKLKKLMIYNIHETFEGVCLKPLINKKITRLALVSDERIILPHLVGESIRNFRYLRNLLLQCFNLEPEMLQLISQNKTLEALYIGGSEIMKSKKSFGNFSHLKAVQSNATFNTTVDQFLLSLGEKSSQLEDLIFTNESSITENSLAAIARLPRLKSLVITENKFVTDKMVEKFTNLECLNCRACDQIKDDGLIRLIEKTPHLKQLYVQNTSVTINLLQEADRILRHRTVNSTKLKIKVDEDLKKMYNENNSSPLFDFY